MSKDVIIAGAIAAGCVALVAVALLAPKSKPEGEPAKTAEPAPLPSSFDTGAGAGGFSFGPATAAGFDAAPVSGGFAALPPVGTGTSLPPAATGFGPSSSLNPAAGPVALPGIASMPAPVEAPAAAGSEHTVAAGELLGDISLKHYGSSKHWKRIADANPGIDPRALKVGQKLKIPPAPGASEAPAVAGAGAAAPGERTYTIKAKDSLYGIAQRELGKGSRWKEIQTLNPGLNGNDLKVGKVIKLPGSGGGTGAAASGAGADASSSGSGKTHTVAKGETLAEISKKHFGTSKRWKDIVAANPGLSPENLKVGQKLNIPGGSASASAADATAPASAAPGTGDYTVKPGDTIRSIAASQLGNGNDWKKIQDANPGLNPRALRTGQTIKIPGKAGASAAPSLPVQPAAASAAPLASGAPGSFAPAPIDAGPAVPDFANPYAPAPSDAGGFAPLGAPAGAKR